MRIDLVNVNMGKCKEFSTPVNQNIVDKYLSGQKNADICRDLKIPCNSIYSVIQRYLARGTVRRAPRSGRKQKMDARETRKLVRVVKTRRTVPPAGITDMINQGWRSPVSQRTVKRQLYKNNYHRRIIRKKI